MSRKKGGTYELFFKYIHKSRLLKKWGGNYIYTKQDFHVTSFLTSYFIESQVFFYILQDILFYILVFDNLFLNWLSTCV